MSFAHLHVHTEYSVLDGMCKIKELLSTAKDLGQSAIAITDHGTTSGLYQAQKLGKEIGIKVILGNEFYYERENDHGNGHLIVLAKNNKGLENILKLQEFSYIYNFYRKPRIKWEVLKDHHEGLIVSTACLGSTFSQLILNNNVQGAIQWAKKFQNVFGDDFYIEIMPNDLPEQLMVNQTAIRIAKQLGIKFIATNDTHYVYESDVFPHEVLLAMQTKSKMSSEKRYKFPSNDFWLKSEDEMRSTFAGISPQDIDKSILTTVEVVEKCDAYFRRDSYLPHYYNVPEGILERQLLVDLVKDGLKHHNMSNNKDFIADVQNEINVIDRNGYSGYFLIVQDYVNSARNNGIVVGDGRGSGAGSKVAWLTGITKIAPHKHDLLFERFMANGRQPDFDVDFSNQDAVFQDLQNKYGVENVARIIAFGTMTPKAVTRKVLSTFDHPSSEVNYIAKLISDDAKTIEDAISNSVDLQKIRVKYKLEFDVINRLEGIISHESQHAGGVIIYPNLSSFLPIKSNSEDRNRRIVAFDKYMLEELGHYKFDILGLETLPVIQRAINSIKESTGEIVDLYSINYNDPEVYDMLCNGNVSGVFQLTSQGQKVIEQQPRNFKDLIAINALIRPGVGDWNEYIVRRKGKEWSVHLDRMPYMKETVGIITYQEQFLLDAKTLAGWDIAFADKHIRKNKHPNGIREDDDLREKFLKDGQTNGYSFELLNDVWDEICLACEGGYSFNKSHAASYAMISYQTAYLKCKYPLHFYASLMSSEKTDGNGQIEISNYITECKSYGINILPPDINYSGVSFAVNPTDNNSIVYRITTIKHVGETAIQSILKLRPIISFKDFLQRREKKFIKQNTFINLIKAGCFDFDNPNRAELLWQVDMSNRTKTQIKDNYICPKYEWNDLIKAEWEKEVLGMYLSYHPMEKYGFKPLDSFTDNSNCLQGGVIYDIKVFKDKNKNDMAFVFIDTLYGNVKVLVFASVWKYKNIQHLLQINNCIIVKGKRSGDAIILNEVDLLL